MRLSIPFLGALLCASVLAAQVAPHVIAVATPILFNGSDGQAHLAYELSITAPSHVRIERLDVLGDADKPLTTYDAAELEGRTMRPGAKPEDRYTRAIEAGESAVVQVWLTLAKGHKPPGTLRHRLVLLSRDGGSVRASEVVVEAHSAPALVLGAPLRGGRWLAHNGPGNHRTAHWGSALVHDGRLKIPQRYAIDFLGVDENFRIVRGEVTKSTNRDWIGFAAEVVAAHDGVVRETRDGVADNAPLQELGPPLNPSAGATYGNFVIIEVNATTFLHYAHLQRNSVAVKVGERVRRGQKLGLLGNSGNTNGAHLHFNVTNSLRPEQSDGLPFVFASFEFLGHTTPARAFEQDGSPSDKSQSPSNRRNELPLDGAVIRFR